MPLRLIVLDRDGVINEDRDDFVKSISEFQPITGSLKAIARIKQAGYLTAIATNQSGLARGLFSLDTLNAMHTQLSNLLKKEGASIDYIAICPHGPDDHCSCRKPKPGLLLDICNALHIKPEEALFIGDSYRDYEAAQAINMQFALVRSGKGLRTLEKYPELLDQIPIYDNLAEFASRL